MPSERLRAASHLFTVRLWSENLGDAQVEWRGQVMHVLSGEAHFFREWQELEVYMLAMAASAGQRASSAPDVLSKT